MESLREYVTQVYPLPPATWEALTPLIHPSHLKRNTFFAERGDQPSDLGFLQSGSVRAFYRDPKGQDYNKTFFVGPCFFAAMSALVTGQPSQIYIQAMEDCEILRLPYPELKGLYDQHPALERLARMIVEGIFVVKEQREIDLVTLDAKARYLKFRSAFPGLENRIPQYHIASYLGVTPTQLSRIRTAMALSGH